MQFILSTSRIKVVLLLLLIVLGAGSYLYNQYLIEKIREQESASVELWAKAIEFNSQPVHEQMTTHLSRAARILSTLQEVPDSVIDLIEEVELSYSTYDFVTENLILGDRFQVPSVVVDEQGEILIANHLDESELTPDLIRYFSTIHDPIEIVLGEGELSQRQYVYYGESQTIQYLRYFPYFQFGLLALLLGIGYTTYRSITRSEQSNLWVGMAKEAAHQLGTPISSLFGWVQLLKDRQAEAGERDPILEEIENDVMRLRGVAERFNKIGSSPELVEMKLQPVIDQVVSYMESRLPQLGKRVEVSKQIQTEAMVRINPELFHWAVENMIKNSMDAIRHEPDGSTLAIRVHQAEGSVYIDIEDSGKGIDKRHMNEIFKPGYSTKKRGWGLGLSLTRRIIEDYHKGSVKVLRSDPNHGTVMRITLATVTNSEERRSAQVQEASSV